MFCTKTATRLSMFIVLSLSIMTMSKLSFAEEIKTIEPGYLTVAIYGQVLPTIAATEGGKEDLVGIQGAVANATAKKLGLKVKVFQTNFAGAITAVQQKRADLGSGTYWTPERSKVLYFTDATHLNPLLWVVKKDMPYTDASSLNGKVIASTTGYVHNKYFKKVFGDNFREFPGDAQGIQAVNNGQVDAFNSGLAMAYRIRDMNNLKIVALKKGDFGIPDDVFINPVRMYSSCENKALGMLVTQVMDEMKSDGSLMSTIKSYYNGPDNVMSPVDVPADNCGS